MPYAQGRVYYDSDSHLMETADWLHEHASAQERELIGEFMPGGAGPAVAVALARAKARRDSAEQTAKLLEQPLISGPKGWFAYGASTPEERSKALDLLGFDRQLLFQSFAMTQFALSKNVDVFYAGAAALNRGMGAFCAHDPRLLPVGFLPLHDVERTLGLIDAGLRSGLATFMISAEPTGDRSPAHIAHDPIWARLAEANVPIMVHLGAGRMLPRRYHNNGHPRPTDFLGGGENLRAKDYPTIGHAPSNFLNVMVLDGVFERHPGLRCGVIELGGTWVPGLMRMLDHAAWSFRKSEPLLATLSLKPSEYLRRQVRFSLFAYEDVGWLIEQAGAELFMFASDYPHPEGGRDPIGRFDQSLAEHDVSHEDRERFYSGNFAELMGLPKPPSASAAATAS